jgi:hypothetical protein
VRNRQEDAQIAPVHRKPPHTKTHGNRTFSFLPMQKFMSILEAINGARRS